MRNHDQFRDGAVNNINMDKAIFSKLSKIKALADRGEGGEKENARQMFEQLLASNGYTIQDFEAECDVLTSYELIVKKDDVTMFRLFVQIVHSMGLGWYGYTHHLRGDRKHTQIVKGTAAQIEDFKLKWEVYTEALKEELEATVLAFYYANNIFPPKKDSPDVVQKKPSEMSAAEKKAIKRMMDMEAVNVRKRLQ